MSEFEEFKYFQKFQTFSIYEPQTKPFLFHNQHFFSQFFCLIPFWDFPFYKYKKNPIRCLQQRTSYLLSSGLCSFLCFLQKDIDGKISINSIILNKKINDNASHWMKFKRVKKKVREIFFLGCWEEKLLAIFNLCR